MLLRSTLRWASRRHYEQAITTSGVGLWFSSPGCVLSDPPSIDSNITLAPYDTCANAGAHNGVDRSSTYVKEWTGIYWVIYSGPRVGTDLTWISRMSTGRGRCVARKRRITVLVPAVVSRRLTGTSKAVALGYVLPTYASCSQRISGKKWEGFNYALVLALSWQTCSDTWCHTAWI